MTAGTARPSVLALVGEALSTHGWRERFPWGGGARFSHVVRHIAARLVCSRWPESPAPAAGADLDERAVAVARSLIEDLLPVVSRLVEDQVAITASAAEQLTQMGRATTAAALSEPCAVRLGSHAARTDAPVDRRALAAELVGRSRPNRPMGEEQFCARFADDYDAAWCVTGVQSLAGSPPGRIQLGPDVRPELATYGATVGWMQGTARSVYSRYGLAFRADSGGDPHPVGAGHAEIARTCAPYGLSRPEHRVVLEGLARVSWPEPPVDHAAMRARWHAWCADTTAVSPTDQERDRLADAAAAKLLRWSKGSIAKELIARRGHLADYDELIARALVRKTWMALHRQERSGRGVATARDVAGWVCTALDRAVPEGVDAWWHTAADRAPERLTRTSEWLMRHPGIVGELRRDLEAGLAAYEQAARATFGWRWRAVVLDTAELRQVVDGAGEGAAP